jgi:hypothetical protein
VELQFEQQPTGLLSLFDSTASTAAGPRTLFGSAKSWFSGGNDLALPPHAPGNAVRFSLTSQSGSLSAASYDARVAPQMHTVVVDLSLTGHGRATPIGAGLAATLTGFDAFLADGTEVPQNGHRTATGKPWVLLRNGRCSVLVWGRGLMSLSVLRRPSGFGVADYMFDQRLSQAGKSRLGLTFLYGETPVPRSPDALGGPAVYSGSVSELVRRLRAR